MADREEGDSNQHFPSYLPPSSWPMSIISSSYWWCLSITKVNIYPEISIQWAASIVTELPDVDVIAVHDVDMASDLVGVGLDVPNIGAIVPGEVAHLSNTQSHGSNAQVQLVSSQGWKY